MPVELNRMLVVRARNGQGDWEDRLSAVFSLRPRPTATGPQMEATIRLTVPALPRECLSDPAGWLRKALEVI